MKTYKLTAKFGALCALALVLFASSCKNDNNPMPGNMQPEETTGPDVVIYALTSDSKLISVNAKAPSAILSTVSLTGLQSGETLVGIDFRPATGQLYGLGSSSRLYVINVATGVARSVSAAPFTTPITASVVGAGFDFNPTVDRIRYVGFNNQNLRINPETGAVAFTDGSISGPAVAPGVSAVAYTQNRSGATSTVLFDIELNNDKLYKQDPPNDGKLVEVGALGLDAEATAGFDINPAGSAALAVMTVKGKQGIYSIDLASGKAVRITGNLPATVTAIAIPTEPVAYAVNTANELVIFNPNMPAPVAKAITGLQSGETILGIDMRPVNGQLYALGSTSRLYTVNLGTGALTQVGSGTLTTPLLGTDFAFDFNPTVDRIRVVSNLGQNLRLNPVDGSVAAIDGAITPVMSAVTAGAYTNNFPGATTTLLFDIDAAAGRLFKQDPPNMGTLVDVGALGVTGASANGFDIGGTSGNAYALLTVGGVTKVYSVNLMTGAATAGATLTGNFTGFALGLGF